VPRGSAAVTLVRRLYKFDATQHATGAVTILGWRHDNATAGGGEAAALAFVEMLAQHPATAERIARKLCVLFLGQALSRTRRRLRPRGATPHS
jgi:uncharacterized protein (DUF1800 family)